MNLALVVTDKEAEKAWNAFRFGVKALESGHAVRAFLLGAGVECEAIREEPYDVAGQMQLFAKRQGEILACGTCLRSRHMNETELCPISTMQDLLDLTVWADRVLTF